MTKAVAATEEILEEGKYTYEVSCGLRENMINIMEEEKL